jgi:hypothetical protein
LINQREQLADQFDREKEKKCKQFIRKKYDNHPYIKTCRNDPVIIYPEPYMVHGTF